MSFRNSKTLKIELFDYGNYLGRNEGCFEVRNKRARLLSINSGLPEDIAVGGAEAGI